MHIKKGLNRAMVKLTIDDIELEVAEGKTVLQACEDAGIVIPRFCYHERLSIAGSCRMCLVEMERSPKLIASCAMPVSDGMVIKTNTQRVATARKSVMELLLVNHPLDCPVCDQGGECDLQDQAMAYGSDKSRNKDGRRVVKDKYLGPLISTAMTRCIQCTRCVRFATEVAGTPELGGLFRSEHLEITPYIENTLTSELSGNLVDVCPVGALTNSQFAFKARPWELKGSNGIDISDAIGSNIRFDSRANEVLRIVPRINDDINENWLADKGRYIVDAFDMQRIDRPWLKIDGKLQAVDWQEAFDAIATKFKATDVNKQAAIAGNMVDAEGLYSFNKLLDNLGIEHKDCRNDNAYVERENPASWRFNSSIAAIDDADALLIIGANPRVEAAVLNARIRRRYLSGNLQVALLGSDADLTYKKSYLGDDFTLLNDILANKHEIANVLQNAQKPMIIVGQAVLCRDDAAHIMDVISKIATEYKVVQDNWFGLSILQVHASRTAAYEIGFLPSSEEYSLAAIYEKVKQNNIEMVWLYGADEVDFDALQGAFKVYIGHHGDKGASNADVILPSLLWTEKHSTWINTEGRAQKSFKAVNATGEAKEDWKIFRALSEHISANLSWNNIKELWAEMEQSLAVFKEIDSLPTATWKHIGKNGEINKEPALPMIKNYYMTNVLCRNSKLMAMQSKEVLNKQTIEG